MFTKCPKCETVFHITMEQLRVHEGVVRCGKCDHVFNADQQLFSDIPGSVPQKAAPKKKSRAENAAKPKPSKPKTAGSSKRVPVADVKSSAASKPIAKPL